MTSISETKFMPLSTSSLNYSFTGKNSPITNVLILNIHYHGYCEHWLFAIFILLTFGLLS